jgi:hypothetical protein
MSAQGELKQRLLLFSLAGMLVMGLGRSWGWQTIDVGRFSAMVPGGPVSGWEPMTFRKISSHTRYTLVQVEGRTVLRAESHASASGMAKMMNVSPLDFPLITWRWKIGNVLSKGDVNRKSGDDYAARIYITFADDPSEESFLQRTQRAAIKLLYGKAPPSSAIAYVWGNRSAVGSIHPNPYTKRVQMIVVESGPANLNRWRSARRNIVDDYRLAFGTDPPPISGVAVMTDTDNTGESAVAWYGDIAFRRPE